MAAYFIIGTGTSVIALTLFCLVVGVRRPPAAIRLFMPVGLSSLLAYTVGNILLNLFGKTATLVGPALFLILFFVAVLAITTYVERLPFYRPINGLLNLRFERFSRRI
jgi:uncharacterized membrane protein